MCATLSAKALAGLVVRELRPSDVAAALSVVDAVFDAEVAPTYTREGAALFRELSREGSLASGRDILNLVAEYEGRVVGVLRLRGGSDISMLFVDAGMRHHGVGRLLVHEAIRRARAGNPQLAEVTVGASPNAVHGLRKLGFVETGPEQVLQGIAFTPMACRLAGPESDA